MSAIDSLKQTASTTLDSKQLVSLTPSTNQNLLSANLPAYIPNGTTIELTVLVTGITSYSFNLEIAGTITPIYFPTATTTPVYFRITMKRGKSRLLLYRVTSGAVLYNTIEVSPNWSGSPLIRLYGRYEGTPVLFSGNMRVIQ